MSLIITGCHPVKTSAAPEKVLGQLKVGFDIDDTILLSRENFLKAPPSSDNPDHVDFSWINTHDSLYSVIIEPISQLNS